ncbi:protein kinase [Cellulomonas sp. JZ18]|uniref:serine/threonine-protein kinase n=1 Tax=Cellulomonas sp. JZ18 TaxID=2654191 RepID=UPI0012D4227F|nr:serine/threonine-protein kinase [Cellulomonas sp. JZ18]QGQ19300.1 protein kinase [Cellulomonas sp. JZ18]
MLDGASGRSRTSWTDGAPAHDGPVVLGDRYVLEDVLGRGGSGVVHRARDQVLGREVAVKVLPAVPGDSDELRRHEAEIGVLARLRHPGLVRLFDADSVPLDGGLVQAYLVMEIVRGPSLADRLRQGHLTARQTAAVGRVTAEALAVVHAQGVVHRDVKPGNVLLVDDACLDVEPDDVHEWRPARLVDFGIARLAAATRLTVTGTVLGTVAYLSPEQAVGGEVGPASDVYALGLVLLEAVTGRRAFSGTTAEVAAARLTRDPEVPADLDPGLRALLGAMTRRRPEDRPSAREAAQALSDVLEGVAWQEATRAFAAAAPDPRSGPATDDEPTVAAPVVVPGAAATPAERRAAEALLEDGLAAPGDDAGRTPPAATARPAQDDGAEQDARRDPRTGPVAGARPGPDRPATAPVRAAPAARPGRRRAALVVTAVLALGGTVATVGAVQASQPPPEPPAYPVVDGPLGDALDRLQRSVAP